MATRPLNEACPTSRLSLSEIENLETRVSLTKRKYLALKKHDSKTTSSRCNHDNFIREAGSVSAEIKFRVYSSCSISFLLRMCYGVKAVEGRGLELTPSFLRKTSETEIRQNRGSQTDSRISGHLGSKV